MKCKKIVAMCMTVLMLGSFAAAAHAETEEPLPLVEEMLEELEETEEATEPEQPEKDTLPPETTPEEPSPDQDKTKPAQNGGESANTNKKEEHKEARLEARKQKIQAAQALRKQRVESRNEKIKLLTEIRKSIRSLEDKEQKAEMIQALKSIQKSFKEMNQAQRDAIRQELTQLRDKLLSLGA